MLPDSILGSVGLAHTCLVSAPGRQPGVLLLLQISRTPTKPFFGLIALDLCQKVDLRGRQGIEGRFVWLYLALFRQVRPVSGRAIRCFGRVCAGLHR